MIHSVYLPQKSPHFPPTIPCGASIHKLVTSRDTGGSATLVVFRDVVTLQRERGDMRMRTRLAVELFRRGVALRELAGAAGFKRNTLAPVCAGARRASEREVKGIAEFLGLPWWELFSQQRFPLLDGEQETPQ